MEDDLNNILHSEQTDEGVLRLTMNDQKNRNALSEAMMNNLIEELTKATSTKSIRVVIIASIGSVFSAGHDLKEITAARNQKDFGEAYFRSLFDTCSSLMQLIVSCPKPVIAEVAGTATAAGCQLVASCDLATAADSVKFATPGVNIGLFCSTPMVALSRNVNKKSAMEMLLTGDMINAKKAKEIGLINNYFQAEKLTRETMFLANKIASKSSMTVSMGKGAFYAQSELDISAAYEYTSKVMVKNILKEDAKEGIGAFIEKRSPGWE
ncbi:MAG TPA: enoyl-CoA hydratase [Dehalococcoidia bacterium]|jgi:enoyl-CoA hydratase/carnithine racemase|nr:enoyl-CoA hydratase [Dehalococcoidia bacterium]